MEALFGGTSGGIDDMQLTDSWVDSYGHRQDVQTTLDRINFLWHTFFDPGAEPSRIPGDTNRTNLRDALMDNTAWTNQILGLVARLSAASGTDPTAVAQALRPALAEIVGPVVKEAVTEALGADHDATAQAIVDSIAARLSRTEQGGTQ